MTAGARVIAQTDQAGRTTHYEYDAVGRLTAVVDALNQRTEYSYDEAGNLLSRKDANLHVTSREYDGRGQGTATVLPALPGQQPFRSTTQYDAVGNIVSTTDFNGNTFTFDYDERNRLSDQHFPDSTSLTFTYTLTGQRATVEDDRGTTHYVYDERDRLVSRTDPDGMQISYVYDVAGNRTADQSRRDHRLHLRPREPPGDGDRCRGRETDYLYDAAGNLVRTDLPNGTVETRTYDALNRLTFLENRNASGVISNYDYSLAPTGRRDAVVEDTGRRVDYSYDALDRLTREKIIDAVFGDRTIDYTYDAVGNRLTRADSVEGRDRLHL